MASHANYLILTLLLSALLVDESLAGFDLFGLAKKKEAKRQQQAEAVGGAAQLARPEAAAAGSEAGSAEALVEQLSKMEAGAEPAAAKRRRPNLSKLAEAAAKQAKLSEETGFGQQPGADGAEQPAPAIPRYSGRLPQRLPSFVEYDESGEQVSLFGQEEPAAPSGPFRGRRLEWLNERHSELGKTYVPTNTNSANAKDKRELKPSIRLRPESARANHTERPAGAGSRFFKGAFLKGVMSSAIKSTRDSFRPVANALKELPQYVERASDQLSAMLKLDSRGRLLALIEEVNEDIRFVKREFSSFAIVWSPLMERALNHLGATGLNKVRWSDKDDLDHRGDALFSLTFGYEFMRMMIVWRENLLIAHEAYKLYLETIKTDMLEAKPEADRPQVDEDFIFQLKTIHNYILLSSWLVMDAVLLEPRLKLDFLMNVADDQPKNYESDYFRSIVVLQELYEPTKLELDAERHEVTDAVGRAGVLADQFRDVDQFFDNFRDSLAAHQVKDVDWEVPQQLHDFMESMRPQLQYNQLVYSKTFLKELKEAKEKAAREFEEEL